MSSPWIFGCVELIEQHGSTGSNVSSRVETWWAKWNLGYINADLVVHARTEEEAKTLCSRRIRLSLYSRLPSIIPVSGFANHSLKSRCDWKTCGMRKCISDHSSIRLFCSGVPVSSRRRWLWKLSRVCQRCDLKFFMFCAWTHKINHTVNSKCGKKDIL